MVCREKPADNPPVSGFEASFRPIVWTRWRPTQKWNSRLIIR